MSCDDDATTARASVSDAEKRETVRLNLLCGWMLSFIPRVAEKNHARFLAASVHIAKVALSVGIRLFSCLTVRLHDLGVMNRDTPAIVVHKLGTL